eukprot:sb/3462987/
MLRNFNRELVEVPVFNFTRCARIKHYKRHLNYFEEEYKRFNSDSFRYTYIPNCMDLMDQTNCSDPARVALSCPIGGYMSTVAKVMVCDELREGLCDDNLDILCVDVTFTCTIHKHQICDGTWDCSLGEDESDCLSVSTRGCHRKMDPTISSPIPLSWLGDGVVDCIGGEDEILDLWPVCGTGIFQRFSENGQQQCKDVYICKFGPKTTIPSQLLCDGVDTCGNENKVCRKLLSEVATKAVGIGTWNKFIGYCLPGLESINSRGVLSFQLFCLQRFDHTWYHTGDPACSGLCSVKCPISKSPPKIDSCPHQFKQKIFTIAGEKQLTFVTPKEDSFGQEIFQCRNNKCLPFEKVCNLINDCGDGSDEEKCSNHFKCKQSADEKGNTGGQLIPLYKVCDSVPDCADLSDECNERCGKQILQGLHLKIGAFLLGFLAIGLNLWTIGTILTVICLATICTCYMVIEGASRRSLAKLNMNNDLENNPALKERLKQQQKTQRKVTLIIVTDLICWLPILVTSFCHMTELVDATPYYGIFSVIVLPINSVINPLLYNNHIYDSLQKVIDGPRFINYRTAGKLVDIFLIMQHFRNVLLQQLGCTVRRPVVPWSATIEMLTIAGDYIALSLQYALPLYFV